MFSSILKVIPKLDAATLRGMERTLQSKFTKLAKGFGKGLMSAIKGGGIAGLALGLVDKLLNPLKEVQEAIDASLKSSDDISTNAKHFRTSTGRLAKGIAIAESAGLDQDSFFTLLNKFQSAKDEAKEDPNKPSAVRNFADRKDTLEAFFDFMSGLKKMEGSKRTVIENEVFGERNVLKLADLAEMDYAKQYTKLKLNTRSTDLATKRIDKGAALNDLSDELAAVRKYDRSVRLPGMLNESMAYAKDRTDRLAEKREEQRIGSYHSLVALSNTSEKMMILLEGLVAKVGDFIPKATKFIDTVMVKIDKLLSSPWIRGIFGKKDK